MGKKKVVLDTNILISALGWKGKPRQIFQKCISGHIELVTSKEQLEELQEVMDYPKFKFTKEQKTKFISIILDIAEVIKIKGDLKVIKEDPDDNMILETALVSDADYIISGDPHLLNLGGFNRINILKPSDFLSL
jgi:putative PIN family toxin of toxin-antitoxin system